MKNGMIKTWIFCACLSGIMAMAAGRAMANITLVAEGKSDYAILLPDKAPQAIQTAAKELQRDIHLASGVALPIVKEAASNTGPFISLGATRQAKQAGLNTADLAVEGFRILTKDHNLYIAGVDTADGDTTPQGGVSNGTANGVYAFLEQYLGVRWLMPGKLGLDVPTHDTIKLPDIDQSYAPLFTYRKLGHLWDYANHSQRNSIRHWLAHQRVGDKSGDYSTKLYYGHNWVRTLNRSADPDPLAWGSRNAKTPAVQELYNAHPVWFAMNASGKRRRPTSHTLKFETTNPQLVAWFAHQAIRTLKARVANKQSNTFSLSPSDGRGYSQSPESKALYDPPPPGSTYPSVTPLILKWYNDISRIVAKAYPQGRLTGFLYQQYLWPPKAKDVKLPVNFTPMMAFSPSYQYGLYRTQTQEHFKYVMDAWAKIISGDWYYYDLPNQFLRQYHIDMGGYSAANFPGGTANVMPAAPEILNLIFSTLLKDHIKGAYFYGTPAWGSSALNNYLLAQMMWNPRLDAQAIQKDWLDRAYGPQAGALMLRFHTKLDGWVRDYYQKTDNPDDPDGVYPSALTLVMLKNLYAPHYSELEKLYLDAQDQPMNAGQKQRLQLIGDNLIVLQWRLRNAGYWPADLQSALQRDTRQVIALIERPNADFQTFPGLLTSQSNERLGKPVPFAWKVRQLEKSRPSHGAKAPRLNAQTLLLYAARDAEIRIIPQSITQSAYFATYELKDAKGKLLQSGILGEQIPVRFSARAGQAYYLYLPPRKPVHYKLKVEQAAVASGELRDGVLSLSQTSTPIAVYYSAADAPIGVIQDDDSVVIQYPYSGTAGVSWLQKRRPNYRDVKVLHNLDMGWRFNPDPEDTGLKRGVTTADFDDTGWATLSALDWWQMQGFADYHGPAWYRMQFDAPALASGQIAMLYFGAADGNAVVYLNGQKIGEHRLGENYKGWDWFFFANATQALRPGRNILAIKVTSKDKTTASGLFKGVSLLTARDKP